MEYKLLYRSVYSFCINQQIVIYMVNPYKIYCSRPFSFGWICVLKFRIPELGTFWKQIAVLNLVAELGVVDTVVDRYSCTINST